MRKIFLRDLNLFYNSYITFYKLDHSFLRCEWIRAFSSKGDYSDVSKIRNFSIVAHVDHGKSTLADRLLEITGAIKAGGQNAQVLDQLQVERERGITVKAVTASLNYTYKSKNYLLNLIDTPGHVDFSNEVVRSVTACQGVILLVDANEGIQAQTVAVHSLAKRNNLVVIPVLNKVDLPRADPDRVTEQLKTIFGIDKADVLKISAKKGWGVPEVLNAIVERIPPPPVDVNAKFVAHVFDSWHDRYRGVLCLAYIRGGKINVGDNVRWSSSTRQQQIKFISILRPQEDAVDSAVAGQVVMIGCGPKGGGSVGELLTLASETDSTKAGPALPAVRHMVYAGIFPSDQSQHTILKDAITKLALNDSAVSVTPDSSPALGQGWRVGFLGLLHLEVFTQRLLQEYQAEAILTAPSVPYKIRVKGSKIIQLLGGEEVIVTNPVRLPSPQHIEEYYEPFVIGTIITPVEYLGVVTSLCMDRRGTALPSNAVDEKHVLLQYVLPLSEVVLDFHDALKSITSGYASFDYQDHGFHASPLVKMEIQLNGVPVDELSTVVHASRVEYTSRRLVEKLKEMIPRQMVQIAIQAVVNGRVCARETLKAYRKDVTAKLYGGDITRRKKLLKQQSEGKKKMRSVANIKIPRDTFINVLKR